MPGSPDLARHASWVLARKRCARQPVHPRARARE